MYVYSTGEKAYIGNKNDTKPPGQSGDILVEIDKDLDVRKVYKYDGSSWILKNTVDNHGSINDDVQGTSELDGVYTQLGEKANQSSLTTLQNQVNNIGNASPKGVYSTVPLLTTEKPTGDTGIYLVTGDIAEVSSLVISVAPTSIGNVTVTLNGVATNIAVTSGVAEVASLTVTAPCSSSGDVTVTLNGVGTNVALDSGTDTTTDLVATKIRNTAFSGWTTGGTGSVVTFTASAVGVKTDASYSAGTTGATGTMSTTTQGVDADTTSTVATKIRGTSFSGWTTGGSGTTITFTCNTTGVKTDSVYSPGSTGTTGTMTTTTQGVDADYGWYYWNGSTWTLGGTYQGKVNADSSILIQKLEDSATKKDYTTVATSPVNGYKYVQNGTLYTSTDAAKKIATIIVVPGEKYAITGTTFYNQYTGIAAFSDDSNGNLSFIQATDSETGNKIVEKYEVTVPSGVTKMYVNLLTSGKFIVETVSKILKIAEKNLESQIIGLDNFTDLATSFTYLNEEDYVHYKGWIDGNGNTVGTTSSGTEILINKKLPFIGRITDVSVYVNTVQGDLLLNLYRKTESGYDLVSSTILSASASVVVGVNTFSVDIDVPEENLYMSLKGCRLATVISSLTQNFYNSSFSYGNLVTGTFTEQKGALRLYVKCTGRISVNDKFGTLENADEIVLLDEDFSVSNADFVYTGATLSSGLNCTDGQYAYLNKYFTFDSFTERSIVKLNNITSVFAMLNYHTLKGAVYVVDGVENKIKLCQAFTGSNTVMPTVIASQTIPFTLVQDRLYLLETIVDKQSHTFTLYDTVTGQSVSVSHSNCPDTDVNNYVGYGWGGCGLLCYTGSITCTRLKYIAQNANNLMIGDSITQGYNIQSSADNRWSQLLKINYFNGDALIYGRGGGATLDLLERLNLLDRLGYKFEKIIILIGANETGNLSMWQQNIGLIYNFALGTGATVYVGVPTLVQNTEDNAVILQMRDYILAQGWKKIRFDIASSSNYDGQTFLGVGTGFNDGLHPDSNTHLKMKNRAILDMKMTEF